MNNTTWIKALSVSAVISLTGCNGQMPGMGGSNSPAQEYPAQTSQQSQPTYYNNESRQLNYYKDEPQSVQQTQDGYLEQKSERQVYRQTNKAENRLDNEVDNAVDNVTDGLLDKIFKW